MLNRRIPFILLAESKCKKQALFVPKILENGDIRLCHAFNGIFQVVLRHVKKKRVSAACIIWNLRRITNSHIWFPGKLRQHSVPEIPSDHPAKPTYSSGWIGRLCT